jgi:hypothetical protein
MAVVDARLLRNVALHARGCKATSVPEGSAIADQNHQYHDECTELKWTGCADPNRNTMNFYFPGETCHRDLSMWDIANANVVYPNP